MKNEEKAKNENEEKIVKKSIRTNGEKNRGKKMRRKIRGK